MYHLVVVDKRFNKVKKKDKIQDFYYCLLLRIDNRMIDYVVMIDVAVLNGHTQLLKSYSRYGEGEGERNKCDGGRRFCVIIHTFDTIEIKVVTLVVEHVFSMSLVRLSDGCFRTAHAPQLLHLPLLRSDCHYHLHAVAAVDLVLVVPVVVLPD